MNDGLNGEVSSWLAPPGGDGLHPWCDKRGAFIGAGMPIVERRLDALGRARYEPVPLERLNRSLSIGYEKRIDVSGRVHGLRAVAKALAAGDIVAAVSALGRVGLPPFPILWGGSSRADRLGVRKYDPSQQRWPKGAPDSQGGEWEPEGANDNGIPGPGHNRPPPDLKPNRWISAHKAARAAARVAATIAGRAQGYARWIAVIVANSPDIVDKAADIKSYFDGPKSMDELRLTNENREYQSFDALKRDLRPEGSPGYQLHHIVEQNPANVEQFGQGKLQNTANVIEVPTYKHEEITAYYNSKTSDSGELTVREWLSTKPYEFQQEYGLEILRMKGVLK